MKSPPESVPPVTEARTREEVTLLVWDLPVRVFHWGLVLLLLVSWTTGQDGGIDEMTWHLRAGLAILALLLARIAWGLIGSQSARFVAFVRGPRAAWDDAHALLRRRAVPHAGHPPLGGWMVMALLVSLLVQCVTGLFATDSVMTEGPLFPWVSLATSEWLTTIHRWNVNVLLTLAAIHVGAVAYHRLALGSDLLSGMFTGRRRLPADTPAPRLRSPALAVASLVVAAALVALLVR